MSRAYPILVPFPYYIHGRHSKQKEHCDQEMVVSMISNINMESPLTLEGEYSFLILLRVFEYSMTSIQYLKVLSF